MMIDASDCITMNNVVIHSETRVSLCFSISQRKKKLAYDQLVPGYSFSTSSFQRWRENETIQILILKQTRRETETEQILMDFAQAKTNQTKRKNE